MALLILNFHCPHQYGFVVTFAVFTPNIQTTDLFRTLGNISGRVLVQKLCYNVNGQKERLLEMMMYAPAFAAP